MSVDLTNREILFLLELMDNQAVSISRDYEQEDFEAELKKKLEYERK